MIAIKDGLADLDLRGSPTIITPDLQQLRANVRINELAGGDQRPSVQKGEPRPT